MMYGITTIWRTIEIVDAGMHDQKRLWLAPNRPDLGVKMWILPSTRFDNHDMALMLIEILYEQNQLNEETYQKIMKKYGGKSYGAKRKSA